MSSGPLYLKNRRRHDHPVVREFVRSRLEQIRKSVPAGAGVSCLEVAAGDGYFSSQLQELFRLTATEPDAGLLSTNPALIKAAADAGHLPFEDRSFDLVFEAFGLHHMQEISRAMDELCRVARQWVVLIEPNPLNPLQAALAALDRSERAIFRLTPRWCEDLLRSRGFSILQHTTFGILTPNRTPAIALPILAKFERPLPLIGMDRIIVASRSAPEPRA